MRQPKLTVHQGKDGQWYGRVTATNGQIVLVTEGFTRQWSAKRGLAGACVTVYDWVDPSPWGERRDKIASVMEDIEVIEPPSQPQHRG